MKPSTPTTPNMKNGNAGIPCDIPAMSPRLSARISTANVSRMSGCVGYATRSDNRFRSDGQMRTRISQNNMSPSGSSPATM